MKNEWQGKQVLVLGLGDTGVSSVRWLTAQGARVRAADSRPTPPGLAGIRAEHPEVDARAGPFDDALLEGVDTVLASPGIALRERIVRTALARGIEVLGDVEIFAREVRARGKARVIGITGTNGKSTVTALAGDCLLYTSDAADE